MPKRVLIVDDDRDSQSMLDALLTSEGYEVRLVSSLQSAAAVLAQGWPDLLITDVRLGSYNGLQLLATAERIPPTIVITGFSDPVIEQEAARFGATYLLKPVSISRLLAAVTEKLTSPPLPAFQGTRRWPRKAVDSELPTSIGHSRVRVLDVSYGGMRLELDRATDERLPPSFRVALPQAQSIEVDIVWKRPRGESQWVCGASVADNDLPAWRAMVDRL